MPPASAPDARAACGWRRSAPRAGLLLVVSLSAACATHAFVRPVGPFVAMPAAEAAAAWDAATRACRDVRTVKAILRISFPVSVRRIPTATVGLAIDAAGAIHLEAQVSGQPFFRLAGSADRTTLIQRDGRVLVAAPGDIVQQLIGVRLDPARLRAVLSGCVSRQPSLVSAQRAGDVIEATTADGILFLERDQTGWRSRAGEFDAVVVDYAGGKRPGSWPQRIRIQPRPGSAGPAVSVEMTITEFTPNVALPSELFNLDVPPNAPAISLEELGANGPAGAGRP